MITDSISHLSKCRYTSFPSNYIRFLTWCLPLPRPWTLPDYFESRLKSGDILCVCARVCTCVCVCLRACVHVCMCVLGYVWKGSSGCFIRVFYRLPIFYWTHTHTQRERERERERRIYTVQLRLYNWKPQIKSILHGWRRQEWCLNGCNRQLTTHRGFLPFRYT